jgi:hypothetical protein
MQNDEWHRYRDTREPESRFRSVNRRMDGYERGMDDIRPPAQGKENKKICHIL